jgi:hypothetical protein
MKWDKYKQNCKKERMYGVCNEDEGNNICNKSKMQVMQAMLR